VTVIDNVITVINKLLRFQWVCYQLDASFTTVQTVLVKCFE